MAITLIIPAYRNPSYLDLCLKSATENRVLKDTEIIVIVDGYVEESREVIEKYCKLGVGFIELEQNMGMIYATNVGVWNGNTEYVCIINQDNILCNNYDIRLSDEIKKCEARFGDKVVLTIDQVEPTGPGMFNFPVKDLGSTVDDFQHDGWLKYEHTLSDSSIIEDGHVFPFIVQKKWYMAIGGMDMFYHSPNVVDWDMFLKWELLGFKFPRTRAMHFYHFGSVTTRRGPEAPKFKEKELQAMAQYEYKWGTPIYNKPNVNSKIPSNGQFKGFRV